MDRPIYEKRKHSRIDIVLTADVFRFSHYEPKFLGKGVITDLGIGGMKIETNDVIDEKEELLIKFFLPEGVYFDNIRGKIVRTRKESFTFTYGIRFIEMKFRDKFRIWRFSVKNKGRLHGDKK